MSHRDLETDFNRDAILCQPTCDEQIATFREKDNNNHLIQHYLRSHPRELVHRATKFDFPFFDITDGEMIALIDMPIDSRDVYW